MAKGPRVLITGMGAVTPMGVGIDALWQGLVEGRDAIGEITRFDTSDYKVTRAGSVPDVKFDFPEDPALAEYDLGIQFCARAMREAVESAGLARHDFAVGNAAIVLSTNFGQAEAFSDVAESALCDAEIDVEGLHQGLWEFAPTLFAELWGIMGARAMLSLSCASGNAAVAYATDLLRSGRAEMAVVGGFDVISPFCWSGLLALRTMTPRDITPFDKNRSGTIFGEGAGVMVLETETHAAARGARATVEVAGHHVNNNAYHLTAPDKLGNQIVRAMQLALEDARITPAEVDHVNAHGTATKYNDSTETAAIKTVLGKHAYDVPVNSIKSMIGHLMGAASIVETIAAAKTIETGVVPPTIHYETPDPECDLDYCTAGAVRREVNVALSNSAGLGGCNAVVALRKFA